MKRTVLNWGGPGAGKTAFGVSSFWNYMAEEPVTKDGGEVTGRLFLVGAESNPDLGIPDSMVKAFPMDLQSPLGFVGDFTKNLRTQVAAAKRGKGFDNYVVDGLSELNLDFIFGHGQEHGDSDKWAHWRDWKALLVEVLQLLNILKQRGNVFCTARVGATKETDPEYLDDFDYIPLMDGFWRDQLGHYFNFIVHHAANLKKGHKAQTWRTEWLATGIYQVKNTAAHKWSAAGLDPILENATWPQVEAMLEELARGGSANTIAAARKEKGDKDEVSSESA